MSGTADWNRVKDVVHRALDRALADRAAFLRETCDGDQELRAEVESQLALGASVNESPDLDAPTSLGSADRAPTVPSTLDRNAPGRYRVGRELARGGMGSIHEAEDLRLSRTVAVKRLLVQSVHAKARLQREALITAHLQHPAVVPVFDVGELPASGPYYPMKLVEGTSLDRVIEKAGALEARPALSPDAPTAVEAIGSDHQPRSERLRPLRTYEKFGDGLKFTQVTVSADGKSTTSTYSAHYDGKEYRLTGNANADIISLKRIDASTFESNLKKAGKIVNTGRNTVSADGKTMTYTSKGTNASGQPTSATTIFDRQQNAAPGRSGPMFLLVSLAAGAAHRPCL